VVSGSIPARRGNKINHLRISRCPPVPRRHGFCHGSVSKPVLLSQWLRLCSWTPKPHADMVTRPPSSHLHRHRDRKQQMVSRELATGQEEVLVSPASLNLTATCAPDGKSITYAEAQEGNSDI